MLSLLAARIGEVTETNWLLQIERFLQFSDPSLVTSLLGCLLLGTALSLLGSFMVLRKMSLMGDTLGHAVLPGICVAFILAGSKALLPTFIGSLISGLLGVLLINAIVRHSRIKADAAMGMVLSSFFGLGIVLLTMIQKSGSGNQSGLDKFLFGQAAALSAQDVWVLFFITVTVGLAVFLFLKELTLVCFDEGFAQSIGIPIDLIQTLLMILTAMAVVASIQAVGVVLVSAMLIIPPATALLLTSRMRIFLGLGVLFGLCSGFSGAFFSFLGPSLPTGPFMVVSAAFFFLSAFIFAPHHGLLVQFFKRRAKRTRTQNENVLKSIYHLFEQEKFQNRSIALQALAAFRNETTEEVNHRISDLIGKKWLERQGEWLSFTEEGNQKAKQLVRRHRLWELFLVKEHILPADHVHVDAEELEHILPAEVMEQLEQELEFAKVDPHGKPIP